MPHFIRPACLAIIGGLVLFGCDPVETEIVPDPPVRVCSLHVSDSNIVTGIVEEQDSMVFYLENNDRITRSADCFTSIRVDTSGWSAEITYEDSTKQTVPYLGNTFMIEEDSILLNPYNRAPLAALVKFSLPVPGRIRLTVHGRDEKSPDITHEFDSFETHHIIPVFGLYVDYENRVTISVLGFYGNERISRDISIQTAPPGTIECGAKMRIEIDEYTGNQKNKLFLVQNAIYDTQGYVRWYSGYIGNKYFPLANGLIAIQLLNDKGSPLRTYGS